MALVACPRVAAEERGMKYPKIGRCCACGNSEHKLRSGGIFQCDPCFSASGRERANIMTVNEIRFALLLLGVKWP